MAENIDIKNHYLSEFESFSSNGAALAAPWVKQARHDAIERFKALRFPTTHDEEWRFTNLTSLLKAPFRSAHSLPTSELTADEIAPFLIGDGSWSRLVFVDGRFSQTLSAVAPQSDGVHITNLASALEGGLDTVEQKLGSLIRDHETAFTALNSAFVRDGALVVVPKGVVVETPIHMLFLSTGGETPIVACPRNLIVMGLMAHAEIIETYASLNEGTYFNNAVTEILLGEAAILKRYKIQQESDRAYHIESAVTHQDRSSSYTSFSIVLGAVLSRNDVDVILDGEGADAVLDGLYMVHEGQLADNHLTVDHAKPHCASHQLYKGILDDNGRAVFNGKIIVREDAQRTDAKQTNRNLVLSEGAVVDTKPQLEIFADDVKCTHGATVGQLDEDSIFYLRSRGLSRETAKIMLTYGFASDLVNRISLDPLRAHLEKILNEKLHFESQQVEISE